VSTGFVPDTEVRAELRVSEMTMWRWDQYPDRAPQGWPACVRMGSRKYRDRKQFEAFKSSLMQIAIAARRTHAA
jgi:hypothetical protein